VIACELVVVHADLDRDPIVAYGLVGFCVGDCGCGRGFSDDLRVAYVCSGEDSVTSTTA
jgi:hypothetical protein